MPAAKPKGKEKASLAVGQQQEVLSTEALSSFAAASFQRSQTASTTTSSLPQAAGALARLAREVALGEQGGDTTLDTTKYQGDTTKNTHVYQRYQGDTTAYVWYFVWYVVVFCEICGGILWYPGGIQLKREYLAPIWP
jgi:hypothetical protein